MAAIALLAGCGAPQDGSSLGAAYAKPGLLAPLPDGRRINLQCSGSGAPTVLLEAGFGATSAAWRKVAPDLSRTTRVCAYDRAGYGFSDPGPLPRDGADIARDLEQALTSARITGPFVVVGHSAGGLYARLFAARRPDAVKGLVLVDPTVERRAAGPVGDGLDGIRRRVTRCLAVSEIRPSPPPADPQWAGCIGAKADEHAVEIARRPDTWRNQLSELDSLFGRTSEQVLRTRGVLTSVPTYVITASDTAASAPKVGFQTPRSVWELQHEMIAAGSIDGSQQTVLSSHMVMTDRPEVVIAAVEEMVSASRAGRAPAHLPPSETIETGPSETFSLPGPDPLKAPDPPIPPLQVDP